jgi:solute carrier family 35 (UDP-galactose transporter), member B1
MMTMIVSIFMFGHSLVPMQYLGVLFVFGGVGAEAYIGKKKKDESRAAAAAAKGKKAS